MKKVFIYVCMALYAFAANAQDLRTIEINYNGSSATVTKPDDVDDVIVSINGAKVTINSITTANEYCYKVSGSANDGTLLIKGSYKLTLELAGVNLTSTTGAAINIDCGKRIAVILDEGTTNTLVDSKMGTQKAALYFKGHPEFKGGGTLNVTGNSAHAISAKEYLELKSTTGTINILGAVKDGIHCGIGTADPEKNYFLMDGGTVNIQNVGGDCIDSDDFGVVFLNDGKINLNVNTDGGKGIKCATDFNMTGGTINANLYGGNYFDSTEGDYDRCMALNIEGNLNQSNGSININRINEEAKAYKVGGTENLTDNANITILGSHYNVDPHSYQNSMSIYATANIEGIDINNYSNYHIGAFIGNECRGNGEIRKAKDGVSYIYLRTYSNQENGNITFRLFDSTDQTERIATETITFHDNDTYAFPSNPTTLSFSSYLYGDINKDNKVDILDLISLIYYINGNTPAEFNMEAADVDKDNDIDTDDVTALSYILIRK